MVPDASLTRDVTDFVRAFQDEHPGRCLVEPRPSLHDEEVARGRGDTTSGGVARDVRLPSDEGLLGPNLSMRLRRKQRHDDATLFRAVAAAADALYVVDANGRIAFLNSAAVKTLGYAGEEELLGKASHEAIHSLRPDGSPFPAEECPLLRPLQTGETVRVEQDWFVRKDRSRVVVSYSSAPVDLKDGRGAVVAFQDVTHRLRLDQVEASRARIVAASDETRRRIERDLHDGAQQRLVSLALEVHVAATMTPPDLEDLRTQLSRIEGGLSEALDEVREIARGIHPPVLTEGGLEPALKALARRSAIPVELDVLMGHRIPERLEVAAYYLVSEALTNAARHSKASVVHVEVAVEEDSLLITIRDAGIGGADPSHGSGLIGLRDRVETLGGTIQILSPVGRGTSIHVSAPIAD
jgi:PAS domain S-box-containing protein